MNCHSTVLVALSLVWNALAALEALPAGGCSHVVVGGGPGGVYAAYRLAMASPASDAKVCLFERTSTVGGRITSVRGLGPKRDLVVDAGAYRFVPKPECYYYGPAGNQTKNCEWTPLTQHIVEALLGLPTELYDPNPSDASTMRKIVDAQGHNAGYATFVEKLAQKAVDAGRLAVFLQHEVKQLGKHHEDPTTLILQVDRPSGNGLTVHTQSILLNLPQLPLLRLLQASFESDQQMIPIPALFTPVTFPIMKLYVHYQDAWWRNYLNFTGHVFDNLGQTDLTGHGAQFPAPLMGRYFDGDYRCDGPNGACRGFLEAVYTGERLVVEFYLPHMLTSRSDKPFRILDINNAVDANLLRVVHRSLVALHADSLREVGKLELVNSSLPDSAVLSVWSGEAKGFETGCHSLKAPTEHIVDTADVTVYPNSTSTRLKFLRPLGPDVRVYLANEAFGWPSCWAESSLIMAENAVHEMEGLTRPDWLPEDVYRYVLFETADSHPDQVSATSRGDPFLSLLRDRGLCGGNGLTCQAQRRYERKAETAERGEDPAREEASIMM